MKFDFQRRNSESRITFVCGPQYKTNGNKAMIVVIRNKSELKIAYNMFPAIRYSLLSFYMQHTITHTITKYTEVYIILRVHFLRSNMVYGKSLEFTIHVSILRALAIKSYVTY